MKSALFVGILVFTAGSAGAAYLVELKGGERMTVDSYWEDGDQVHLVRGGVDMIVPKSRMVGVHEASDDAMPDSNSASAGGDAPATTPDANAAAPSEEQPVRSGKSTDPEEQRRELEAQKADIESELLRAQRAAFEADARGDDSKEAKRLQGEFKHQQQRRHDVNQELKALDGQ